ncbi:MAG: InlB B-repeat-containing protein [Cystobacterineae bacterium]|nr:InlB B-repeat-containing protein [Cystobacterineae bacterium]
MKTTQNLSPQREFPLKRFSIGTLYLLPCVLLSAALSACSSSTPETIIDPLEGVYTVVFDKNGGDTEANPQSKTVERHMSTIDALPEAPTREGYKFLGWNTQADGSGSVFTANTLVRENLTVYAQWENLDISILPSAEILTPIIDGAYNEHSTRFRVVVSGFKNPADASKASLDIEPISGLSFEVESNPEGNTQNFEVSVEYNGQVAFAEGFATVKLTLENITGYSAESKSTRIYIRDGQAASPSRAIPVNQANIVAFNRYANTAAGLTRHYRLTENISLAEPAQPTGSNWTAIGTNNAPFVGSLNGENHELLRLRIRASGSNYQGLFGYIGEGATLENIRLTEVSVNSYQNVGGLVGWNYRGTVQNSYATGSVNGRGGHVGGLVGYNREGTVQNSYATGSVTGGGIAAYSYVGGLVGSNTGTVHNSYATGSVTASDSYVGGLVGLNTFGTVHNSYATGSVSGSSNYVGGLVGYTAGGTVHNSYATGSVSGSECVGGLVGWNNGGTVQNSYATGSVTGSDRYVGGLVGGNGGTVQNSLALNPMVSGTTFVGRVAGSHNNSTLTNNHAFDGMQNSAGNTTSWSNIGLTYIDGANISAGFLRRREGFPEEFLTSPWRYVEGRLPGLLGQTVEMPAHLAPP